MTPLEVAYHPRFEADYLALPPTVRDEVLGVLATLRHRPYAPGPGFTVTQPKRIADPNVRVAHFLKNRYRLLYRVYASHLVLVGVGPRPGFYRRLDRLRGFRGALGP